MKKQIFLVGCFILLSFNLNAETFQSGITGHYGGNPFSDGDTSSTERLAKIKVWSTNIVYGIQVTYENSNGYIRSVMHGKQTGNGKVLILGYDEYISEISGGFGSKLDSLNIYTNAGRYFQNGGSGGVPYKYQAPDGYSIIGFCGRAYNRIDAIGILYREL